MSENKNYKKFIDKGKRKKVGELEKNQIEKRQNDGFEQIVRLTQKLEHPDYLREVSKNIYTAASNRGLLVGKTTYEAAAASLYTVCRMENHPTPLSEIANKSRADKKDISNIYRSIQREFNLAITPTGSKPFIKRYSTELDLRDEVKNKAFELLRKINIEDGFSGKSPNGYAASTIYLASRLCNRKISQKELADTANTTRVTIRNIYKQQLQTIKSIENIEIN